MRCWTIPQTRGVGFVRNIRSVTILVQVLPCFFASFDLVRKLVWFESNHYVGTVGHAKFGALCILPDTEQLRVVKDAHGRQHRRLMSILLFGKLPISLSYNSLVWGRITYCVRTYGMFDCSNIRKWHTCSCQFRRMWPGPGKQCRLTFAISDDLDVRCLIWQTQIHGCERPLLGLRVPHNNI